MVPSKRLKMLIKRKKCNKNSNEWQEMVDT